MASLMPHTSAPRPPLPLSLNRYVNNEQRPTVKFQKIRRDDKVVVVGRVRVSTPPTEQGGPTGHAYILRRYDTGFISATTMFKASFPTAKPSSEKAEATWIRENFDLFPHPSADFQSYEEMRLAGLWVPCALAEWLAPSYNLGWVVTALMDALPDPEYLKSGEDSAPASLPTPQSKRRKTETTTNGTNGHLTTPSKNSGSSPQKPSSTSSAQKPPSSSKSRTSPAPSRLTPSRAARGRKAASPSPSAPAVEATTTSSRRSARHSTLPKAVEEEEEEEESVPASSAPNFAEEIAESQSLVQKLKAEQEKATEHVVNASKRTREEAEAPLGLTITEHDDTTVPKEERALIHPNRVARSWVPSLAPNQKAAAWGTLAFAIGWGATTFLPQVLPQFF